jgi:hypothetical protein
VLIAGGFDGFNYHFLSSAELYDVGLGFSNAWRPQISDITTPLNLGSSLTVAGSGFRGMSEGSGGAGVQNSPVDYPLMQLRGIESERMIFLPCTNWWTNTLTSLPVWNFPPGFALATLCVGGIPSTSRVVSISVPVPVTTALMAPALTNGSFAFYFTNRPGALFGVLSTTNLALPLSDWTVVGGIIETAPGKFHFTDTLGANEPKRFYSIRSP